MTCRNCDGSEWVCENRMDRPWGGVSSHGLACDCGAGSPCGVCNREMSAAPYVNVYWEHLQKIRKAEWEFRRKDGAVPRHVLAEYAALQKLILADPRSDA